MSADRPTLYGPELLALARSPRHVGVLRDPTHTERRDHPLCGDRVSLQLRVADGLVCEVAHQTRGCALCVASVSVLGDQVLGGSVADALGQAHAVLSELSAPTERPQSPGLQLFAGVRQAPARAGCVALPWEALAKALESTG